MINPISITLDFWEGSQREVLAQALTEKRRWLWKQRPSAFVRDVLQTPAMLFQAENLDVWRPESEPNYWKIPGSKTGLFGAEALASHDASLAFIDGF